MIVAVSAVMGLLVAGMALPFVGLVGLGTHAVAEGVEKLPHQLRIEPLAERSRLLDRRGRVIASFYDENRTYVDLSEVAPVMQKAIVAIEDARFYRHKALDLQGTLRAFITNQTSGRVEQGGSTITQQLVKLTLIDQADTPEEIEAATAETYHRKLNELRYALALEETYSKDWILERYLNIAYFGDGAHGVEAAAHHYFSRPAAELELHEAALLAGLVKNPTGYDPTNDEERALHRRNVVLNRMAQLGLVTEREADEAQDLPLGLEIRPTPNGCVSSAAPFFCDYVVQYLLSDPRLGQTTADRRRLLRTGGLTIRTTVDRRMQRAAERAVRRHVHPGDRAIGALALVEPGTGAVRALAQSRPMGTDKKKGESFINYTVPQEYGDSNGFQAGSTFKAFVLASAINMGIPLDTTMKAPPTIEIPVDRYRGCKGKLRSDDVWKVSNSTGSGRFNLYTGTQQSVNTFFAKLELRTGLCTPYRLARRMGVNLTDPDNQQIPSFTLGVVNTDPLTMASAYGTFAARGRRCAPYPVTMVLDRDGEPLTHIRPECHRVLPKAVADAVNDILRGVQEPGGFGHFAGLALNQPSAGKTGTTNSQRAVWFIGYTPNLAGAAMLAGANRRGEWRTLNGLTVGGERITAASGSGNAGPIWGDAMQRIERWLPDRDFRAPDPRVIEGRKVRVPDVGGVTVQRAVTLLRARGLVPRFAGAGTDKKALVIASEPQAGRSARSGDPVTLYPEGVSPPEPTFSDGGN